MRSAIRLPIRWSAVGGSCKADGAAPLGESGLMRAMQRQRWAGRGASGWGLSDIVAASCGDVFVSVGCVRETRLDSGSP
jgi:hypothetical protein